MGEWGIYLGFSAIPVRFYVPNEDLSNVSVSVTDRPRIGGRILRNPFNADDQWYVSQDYFLENYRLFPKLNEMLNEEMPWVWYAKLSIVYARPYIVGEILEGVTVSKIATPCEGGMIVRDVKNKDRLRYVPPQYFNECYKQSNIPGLT